VGHEQLAPGSIELGEGPVALLRGHPARLGGSPAQDQTRSEEPMGHLVQSPCGLEDSVLTVLGSCRPDRPEVWT
jgi:hypothetical protein